jgi:hypothetical protein
MAGYEPYMALKPEDWVKTESGQVGRVVCVDRLTVFIAILDQCREVGVEGFLESQLTKTDLPVPLPQH